MSAVPTSPTHLVRPWHGAIFDGTFRRADETFGVVAPATGELIATVGAANTEDLERAVAAATEAQRSWGALPYVERSRVLLKAAALLSADPQRIQRWLVPESGSAQGKAAFEVGLLISELEECAALAAKPYGEVLRSVKQRMSVARRVPVGVVGVISPFNFPAILSLRSVAPALALGNAVILKPDPRTPIAGGLALAELLAEAGLPEGLLHVLPGGAEIGAALVEHPGVPCLSFTGSTGAGRRIGATAGPLLKKLHLELGGKNAVLVLPDADIDAAAGVGAWASFLHQGQICMTAGRHLVHRSIVTEYAGKMAEKASAITVGDPTDPGNVLGPVIDAGQRDKIHQIVTDTVAQGAKILEGGSYDGLCYRPTVLTEVPPDSPAMTDEIFGPVAPVVAYDTVDEAVKIINSTEYGLSTSILTANPYAGYELADRIHTGAVHVNDQTVDDEAVAPFGGHKASGVGGHFGGDANLDTFTKTQWVTVQSYIERYPL